MDARLVASRLPAIPLYGQPFNPPHFPGYLPYGPADASAFYSPLPAGENAEAWRAGLTQAAAAAYYDPAFAAHYGYGYGPMGLSDGARRKNATRETTSTLKAWLNEHRKNPYPTKGEKIMLAIITKMTLTQVSTWFANARRRLKKENKMTWSPRNRCGEDDDDDVMDGDDDNNMNNNSNSQGREGHSSAGERGGSRCSTPNPPNLGAATAEGQNRVSGFDLPQQNSRHPFLSRPEISGSFTIRGPTNGPTSRLPEDNALKRSGVEDDEEIDLESVEEDRKDSAFVKRSPSTDCHSNDERERRTSQSTSGSSQLPGVSSASCHPAFQSAASNPVSLLGRHAMHPHGLQPSIPTFGPITSKITRRDSSSPRAHPYSRNVVSSPTSSVASMSSASSPSKPKIWSLADVATSNDGMKTSKNQEATAVTASISNTSLATSPTPGLAMFGGRHPAQGLPPHHQPPLNPEAQATIRNWMDGVMQQKMAAAAAAAAAMSGGQGPPPPFFPGGLLQQHLAAALNPAALAVAASLPRGPEGVRFPPSFPGFAELAAAQRAQMTAHAAELQSQNAVHTTSASLTPTSANKPLNEAALHRHRIVSAHDEKLRSPISSTSSPSRSEGLPVEVSSFNALNSRPESGDSGIASAETSKESLPHCNESNSSK